MQNDNIEELISQFPEAAEETAIPGKPRKVAIIAKLEPEKLGNDAISKFYLRILSDPNEFDLARIEVLKIIGCTEFLDKNVRDQFAAVLHNVLLKDPEHLVRTWASQITESFLDYQFILDAMESIAMDPTEDDLVQGNIFGVFVHAGPSPTRMAIIERLLNNEFTRLKAQSVLNLWNKYYKT